MVGLGDLPGGSHISYANGVSGDGSIVVGRGHTGPDRAFRWTEATGMVQIGDLPGGSADSIAGRISADGSTIIGSSSSASGREAFRWTQATGMQGLGDLPGGTFESYANALTPDGSTIVGSSGVAGSAGTSADAREAFLWTAAAGMIGLGDLPGGIDWSAAYDVSADGKTIVGIGYGALPSPPFPPGGSVQKAVIWDPRFGGGGIMELELVFQMLGIDLDGWVLLDAVGVSADGNTIVGTAQKFGVKSGWIAVIPEPGTGLLLGAGLLGLATRRRAYAERGRATQSM
jgi:probable HAF family extracellular repeat protein